MTYQFTAKVLDPSKRVILYEFVPPEVHTTRRAIARSASTLVKALQGFRSDVDAVYIPHVIDENDRGSTRMRPDRAEARLFASYVRRHDPDDIELIISYPFPYLNRSDTETWIEETAKKYRIGNIVVVGPTHEKPDLPGHSVAQATELIQQMNSDGRTKIFPGAICIDTRRRDGLDEPKRMVAKVKNGTQYFTSQIFYDSAKMIRLLQDYRDESERQGIEPKRVFLSVSPISSRSTLKVIEDLLGREVENDVKSHIFSRKGSEGNRSIEKIEETLRRVFDYCYGNSLGVPLGLCIEHVTESNFRHTYELLESLPDLWKDYHPDSEVPF